MIGHPLKHLPRSLGKHFLVNLTVVSLLSLAPFATQSAEAGCYFNYQCGNGYYCSDITLRGGTCKPRGNAGDSCTGLFQGTCKAGLECDGLTRTCAHTPRLKNEPCGLADPCASAYFCKGDDGKILDRFVSGRCAERDGAGESCSGIFQGSCKRGLECDGSTRKCAHTPRWEGEGCGLLDWCDRDQGLFCYKGICEQALCPDPIENTWAPRSDPPLEVTAHVAQVSTPRPIAAACEPQLEVQLVGCPGDHCPDPDTETYRLSSQKLLECVYYHPRLGDHWDHNDADSDDVLGYIDVAAKVEGKDGDEECSDKGPLGQKMCHGLYLGHWGRTDDGAETIAFLATGQGGTRSAVTGAKSKQDYPSDGGWREGNASLEQDAVFSKLVDAGLLNESNSAVILGFDLAFDYLYLQRAKRKILQGYYDLLTSRKGPNTRRIVLVGASRGGCLSLRLAKKMRQSSEWDDVNIVVVGVDAVCNERQGEMGASVEDCNPSADRFFGGPCLARTKVYGWYTDIDLQYAKQHDLHILQIAGGYGAAFVLGGAAEGIGHALSAQEPGHYLRLWSAEAATFCIGDFYMQRWVNLNHDDVCTRPDSKVTGNAPLLCVGNVCTDPDARLDGDGRTVVDYALDFINENWNSEPGGGTNTSAPRALCGQVKVATTDSSCTVSRQEGADVNNGSWDPDGSVTLAYDPPGPYSIGSTAVTLTVGQGGQSSQCTGHVTVVDATPPMIECPETQTVECTGNEQAPVVFEAVAEDTCSPPVETKCVPSSGTLFDLGETAVACSATDALGNESVCGVTMRVVDTTPPDISGVVASPATLWPPNHKMTRIDVEIAASDICDPAITCRVIEVVSDEPDAGTGEDDVPDDTKIVDPTTVEVRAERADDGDGRVYTITVECVDGSGNVTRATTAVTVPHDKGGRK